MRAGSIANCWKEAHKLAKTLGGIIVPILTPMHADERINEPALRNHIDRMLEGGVHGLFPCGTNGEGYILSEGEKEEVFAICLSQTAGRVPVFAGTGCVGTRDTIRLSRKAADMGADVLSVITPGFAAASQEELYAHYRAVAESVDAPILLYNIPARTGNALAPATVERLSRIPNIVGVKDSSGNFDNILQYIERTRGSGFVVLSGNDSLILWTLLAGGAGGIAGCANVFPETMTAIYERFLAGDIEGARRAQEAVRPFRDCFRFGNPNTVVKAAVALQGYPVGKCRRPFDRLPEEGLAAVRQVLAELAEQGVR